MEKAKGIREKVNIVESLHKTCQLSALGLIEPILNELRYLARALSDVVYYEAHSKEYADALQAADHAANVAINDAIDILVTYIKVALKKIEAGYPKIPNCHISFW